MDNGKTQEISTMPPGLNRDSEQASSERPTQRGGCEHPKTIPAFDAAAALGLSSREVKRKWPRFFGNCPDCGEQVIGYASFEHYLSGDW